MSGHDTRDPVTVSCAWRHTTQRAMLVQLDDGRELWIPLSVITDPPDDLQYGEKIEIEVAAWFAEREELG